MHSPSHASSSQRGRAHDIKAIGSSRHNTQSIRSSGASRAHGGILRGKALENNPNVGDFDSVDVNSQSVDVEAIVNIFPSNTRPTTIDIEETAVIAVVIPFEGALAPLLQHVAKYYSPISGRYFKLYKNAIIILLFIDNNERVYILDSQTHLDCQGKI